MLHLIFNNKEKKCRQFRSLKTSIKINHFQMNFFLNIQILKLEEGFLELKKRQTSVSVDVNLLKFKYY